jgi:COP9 signalosome complex subunit 1
MGYNDMGDFYYQLGDLQAALKSYAQARDYCTADKHIIEMCLNVIKVGSCRLRDTFRRLIDMCGNM